MPPGSPTTIDAAKINRVLAQFDELPAPALPASGDSPDERLLNIAWGVLRYFDAPHRASNDRFDDAGMRRHFLAVGAMARRIAEATQLVPPRQAWAQGLVHDFGKAALRLVMPRSFDKALRQAARCSGELADAETTVIGIDHAGIGQYLARRWGLPPALVEAAGLHHHSSVVLPAGVDASAVQIVQLADAVARGRGVGFSGNPAPAFDTGGLAERLGLSDDVLNGLADGLEAEVAEQEAALPAGGRVAGRDVGVEREGGAEAQAGAARLESVEPFLDRVRADSTVSQVCAAVAEAIRAFLDLPAALVMAASPGDKWVAAGWSDGNLSDAVEELAEPLEDFVSELAGAASVGTPSLLKPPARLLPAVDRFRGRFGAGPQRMVPIALDGAPLAAALFCASEVPPQAGLRQFGVVCRMAATAIAHAQARAKVEQLARRLNEAERRWTSLQPELVRVRALEGIASMAAGTAHELNNPLAVISGRAQVLVQNAGDESVRRAAEAIRRAAESCSEIVNDLMEFSQPDAGEPGAADLRQVLETLRAETIARGAVSESDFALDLAPDLSQVRIDARRLSRLLNELVSNALQATPQEPCRLTVKAALDLTEECLVIQVIDRGHGMTPEVLGRAFDPFYSHRRAGRGRGLGLARVHRWVTAAGGTIRIATSAGDGTQVELRLPTVR